MSDQSQQRYTSCRGLLYYYRKSAGQDGSAPSSDSVQSAQTLLCLGLKGDAPKEASAPQQVAIIHAARNIPQEQQLDTLFVLGHSVYADGIALQAKPTPPVCFYGAEILQFSNSASTSAAAAALPTTASLPAVDNQKASLLNFFSSTSKEQSGDVSVPGTIVGYGSGDRHTGWDPLWFARGFARTAQENFDLLRQSVNELADAVGK